MVDVFHEKVYLAEFYIDDSNPPVCWRDGVMHVRDDAGEWQPIRAAFRYVTQKPWQRIPLQSRTLILNPTVPRTPHDTANHHLPLPTPLLTSLCFLLLCALRPCRWRSSRWPALPEGATR